MKKIILAALGLALSVCLSAQSIVGQWEQSSAKESEGMEATATETITFLEGNAMEDEMVMSMKMEVEEGQSGLLKWKISFKGSWSIDDGILTLTYDRKSLKFEALEKPEGFPDMFMNMLGRKFESNLKKEMKKPEKQTIIELTSDRLKLLTVGKPESATEIYRRKQ